MTVTDAGSLARIGPLPILRHANPSFRWTSSPDTYGIRTCNITGQTARASVAQLSTLIANSDLAVTIAGYTGILEYLHMTGELVGGKRGFYILMSVEESAERPWSVTTYTPFSLSAAYIGDLSRVKPLIHHSAQSRANDFALAAHAVLANPYFDEDSAGGTFTTNPGGTRFTREYDGSGLWPGATEPIVGSLYPAADLYPALDLYPGG